MTKDHSPKSNSGSETRQRQSSVTTRVTQAEKQMLTQAADERRISCSQFMREAAMLAAANKSLNDMMVDEHLASLPKRKAVSAAQGKQIALVLACMGRLMDSLKLIEKDYSFKRQLSQEDTILMFAALRREIMDVRDECFKALRRSP